MALDARGGVAVAEMIIYLPILVMSGILVLRHGFRRQAGWIFLFILSNVRIVGGALHVASEQTSSPNTTLITIYSILESAGLSPLMLATLGFLSTIAQGAFKGSQMGRGLHLMGLLSSIALILTIVGGVKVGDAKTQDDADSGSKYRHIGVILFLILFILVALLHGYFWKQKDAIMKHRRRLLVGISTVLPFLFVRTLYTVLSGFSPASVPGTPPHENSLSKFSSSTGSWGIYLVMSVIAELLTVITYLVVGARTPLQDDTENEYGARGQLEDGYRSDQELRPNFNKL